MFILPDGSPAWLGDRPDRFHTAAAVSDQIEFRQQCHDFGISAATGSLLGGAISAGGSLLGGSTAADASKATAKTYRQNYQDYLKKVAPYSGEGASAVAAMGDTFGFASPGYTDPATGYTVAGHDASGVNSDYYFKGTNLPSSLAPSSWALDTTDPTTGYPTTLSNSLKNFRGSPDYSFLKSEGLRGYGQSAAAAGTFASGGALRGAIAYTGSLADTDYQQYYNNLLAANKQTTSQYQDYYTNAYNTNTANQGAYTNYFNRLASLAGLGQTTNANAGTLSSTTAQGAGNATLAGGQATGSSYTGAGNAIGNGLASYSYLNGTSGGSSYGGGTTTALNYSGSDFGGTGATGTSAALDQQLYGY